MTRVVSTDIEATPPAIPLPTSLWVTAWADPVVDSLGHDPRSRYVESYWLGVLGPSATWLLRHVADRLDETCDGFELVLDETARALGLGMRSGKQGPFFRSIERLCQFGVARRTDTNLAVRRHVPPVTQGQLKRLPDSLQRRHAAWQQAQLHAVDDSDTKARRLALTLLELGENLDAAERQLATWRIEGPTAERALAWAHDRHIAAAAAAAANGDAA